ncbi:MAG: hypothetical protein OZ923_13475 [Comamonadaceae bacterium]|nr:hypothetical protein [Burkholderiales bacterium]MEB2349609.1 hypothetical protein [Comamonadaceae bacterium]
MSKTTFIEAQSQDPVEQALARKALRLLNDPSLQRKQRIDLVRQVQCELLQHRQRQQHATLLREQVRALALPEGYRVVNVQVRDGRVQVAASSRSSFTWLDAGPAPAGAPARSTEGDRLPHHTH